jgi:hypothetical protein
MNSEILKIFLPVIIIFTSIKRTIIIKQNLAYLNYKLFDNSLIFNDFDLVSENLKYKKLYEPKHFETKNFENVEAFCFERIKESNELVLPMYYPDYIDYPTKNDILDFNKFILDKYSGTEKCKTLIEIIEQLLLNIEIPCEILLKYWLHIYTLERRIIMYNYGYPVYYSYDNNNNSWWIWILIIIFIIFFLNNNNDHRRCDNH